MGYERREKKCAEAEMEMEGKRRERRPYHPSS